MKQKPLNKKNIIVTGGNSGIGLEAAMLLAEQGAHIILAVRNEEKGKAAQERICQSVPNASVDILRLDLADLQQVRSFAEQFKNRFESLDLLINNAGVMRPPHSKTKDGFELQFGSNHLGHFALTGLLLPLLSRSAGARIVTVSSLAHKGAAIDFDNLDGSNGYKAMKFYGQSKLANLLFALELDKRLKEHSLPVISVACHPGISATNLFKFSGKDAPAFLKRLSERILQPAEMGALPTVYAATDPRLTGGEYIGPDGKGARKGYPILETPHLNALNTETGQMLWDVSEQLTGVTFDFNAL